MELFPKSNSKPAPHRGPSRDRTLPGKQRIQKRRWMKWWEKHGEQDIDLEELWENS